MCENVNRTEKTDGDTWDRFVNNHPFGWISHLSGWKQVLEKSFSHIKGEIFTLISGTPDSIVAGIPVYKVKSWLTGKRLVSIPFATLSDPLISNPEQMQELVKDITNCKKNFKASYVEIRTLLTRDLLTNMGFGVSNFYKQHYIDLKKDLNSIQKSFSRSCVKQPIQRARKNHLKLKVAGDSDDLKSFYDLLFETRKRLKLPPIPYKFFRSLWDVFGGTELLTILLAVKNGEVISSLLILKFNRRASAEFLGYKKEKQNLSPNHFLFWEGIQMAHAEGYESFDFGRTAPTDKSLMNFKRRWGTKVRDISHFYLPESVKHPSPDNGLSLPNRIIKEMCGIAPNPLFQLIGNFCYRHLG